MPSTRRTAAVRSSISPGTSTSAVQRRANYERAFAGESGLDLAWAPRVPED